MGLLEGKIAIITGAGRGIGRAEALAMVKEGAKVVINDRVVAWMERENRPWSPMRW